MTTIALHPTIVRGKLKMRRVDITPCGIPFTDGTHCTDTKTFILTEFPYEGSLRRCVRAFCNHFARTNPLRSGQPMTIDAFIDLITLIVDGHDWKTITELHNDEHHLGFSGKKIIRKTGARAGESKGIKWDAKEQLLWTLGNSFTEDLFAPTEHPWHIVKICASAMQSKNAAAVGRTYTPPYAALTPCERCAHHFFEHTADTITHPCSLCDCTEFLHP